MDVLPSEMVSWLGATRATTL